MLRNLLSLSALITAALPLFAGCSPNVVGEAASGATTCVYQGQTHPEGSSFPASDGCNTCQCVDGTAACTHLACGESTCTYAGTTYPVGDSFPAGDGCNTCDCQADGSVSCTTLFCGKPTCTYAGMSYAPGATYPALDGCNTCTCLSDGTSGCTKLACACDPAKEWWRHYVATSPASCATIDYGCTGETTAFSNDCGCGCEQAASCPPSFDCQPPMGCDVMALQAMCPYSTIAM